MLPTKQERPLGPDPGAGSAWHDAFLNRRGSVSSPLDIESTDPHTEIFGATVESQLGHFHQHEAADGVRRGVHEMCLRCHRDAGSNADDVCSLSSCWRQADILLMQILLESHLFALTLSDTMVEPSVAPVPDPRASATSKQVVTLTLISVSEATDRPG